MTTVKMTPEQKTAVGALGKEAALGRSLLTRRLNIAGSVAAKIEKLAGSLIDNEFAVERIQREVRIQILSELDFLAYQNGLSDHDPRD